MHTLAQDDSNMHRGNRPVQYLKVCRMALREFLNRSPFTSPTASEVVKRTDKAQQLTKVSCVAKSQNRHHCVGLTRPPVSLDQISLTLPSYGFNFKLVSVLSATFQPVPLKLFQPSGWYWRTLLVEKHQPQHMKGPKEQMAESISPASGSTVPEYKPKTQPESTGWFQTQPKSQHGDLVPILFFSILPHLNSPTPNKGWFIVTGPVTLPIAPAETQLTRQQARGQRGCNSQLNRWHTPFLSLQGPQMLHSWWDLGPWSLSRLRRGRGSRGELNASNPTVIKQPETKEGSMKY